MNRDDLDGWFARADDVLTDWRGSPDAMNSARYPWDGDAWNDDDADPWDDVGTTDTVVRLRMERPVTTWVLPTPTELLANAQRLQWPVTFQGWPSGDELDVWEVFSSSQDDPRHAGDAAT